MGTGGYNQQRPSTHGVLPRLAWDVFQRAGELQGAHVSVSVLEIYGESLHDLLSEQAPSKLAVRQDPNGEIFVAGLTTVAVRSSASLLDVLNRGLPTDSCELPNLVCELIRVQCSFLPQQFIGHKQVSSFTAKLDTKAIVMPCRVLEASYRKHIHE
jgi:hypothetical protein